MVINGETATVFLEFYRSGMHIKLQRVYNSDGKMLCHCIQCAGSGYYYTTEREVYAYCEGRGWIQRKDNPYYLHNCGLNIEHEHYPVLRDNLVASLGEYGKKYTLHSITLDVKDGLFDYVLYRITYRKKIFILKHLRKCMHFVLPSLGQQKAHILIRNFYN